MFDVDGQLYQPKRMEMQGRGEMTQCAVVDVMERVGAKQTNEKLIFK